jgi:hypothetical protein
MTRFTLTSTLVLGLILATVGSFSSGLHAQLGSTGIVRKGYRIASYGKIDTDLQFSEFFSSAHTISAWVMPEFTKNCIAPSSRTPPAPSSSDRAITTPATVATQALYRWCSYERRGLRHAALRLH